MINFRFHIVSLTAVFLAFAVGLVLGTSFLDDATERALKRSIDRLDDDLADAREHNAELQGALDRINEEDQRLDDELAQRLLTNTLKDVPVLVIAPDGLEGEPVERVTSALQQADAQQVGTWYLTDRLVLDDDSEVTDLASALEVQTQDVDALRTDLARDLASVLKVAIHTSESSPSVTSAALAEPPRIAALEENNFIRYDLPDGYEPPEGEDNDTVLLPASGLRIIVVTGSGAVVPDGDVLQPTLVDMTTDGPQPVVVSARTPSEGDETAQGGLDALIDAIRDDDTLKASISTVDNLEMVSGRVASVLALQEAVPESPVIGQYGIGPGAQSLLPPFPQ
jgi:hypothetical protein